MVEGFYIKNAGDLQDQGRNRLVETEESQTSTVSGVLMHLQKCVWSVVKSIIKSGAET
jgi:hypothetical protein